MQSKVVVDRCGEDVDGQWNASVAILIGLVLLIATTHSADRLEFTTRSSPLLAVTSNFTHWSINHLAWDLGACVLLLSFLRRVSSSLKSVASCAIVTAISAPIVAVHAAGFSSYRGLSAIAAMLFIYLAVLTVFDALERNDRATLLVGIVASLGFSGKIAVELLLGAPLFATHLGDQVVPAPVAHLIGAVIGTTGALFEVLSRRGRWGSGLRSSSRQKNP
jgi:hypothetical protein